MSSRMQNNDLVRQAGLQDINEILELKRKIWPKDSHTIEPLKDALVSSVHLAHVGIVGGRIVGFVSGFLTESGEGHLRWEVDLIAVLPDYRGHGLAKKLVEENLRAAQIYQYTSARALIAVDNNVSQKVFRDCGFIQEGQERVLLLADCPHNPQSEKPDGYHILQVITFNYYGLWYEGPYTLEGFKFACSLLSKGGYAFVGALVPGLNHIQVQMAVNNGFLPRGGYHWWLLDSQR